MVIKVEEIKLLIKEYGIWPSKNMGQNFLINENVLEKIVNAANLSAKDNILEIGPGFGILTEELIKKAKKILAIELDKRLVYFLKQKFKREKNLEILQGDVLKIKNQEIFEKLVGKSGDYKIVANLPYSITGAALKKFLSYNPKPKEMILLLQKEVAQRILAKSGKMSLLSLSVWFYGQAELIDFVSKESFYPKPKVDSAILKITLREELPLFGRDEEKFWQILRIGFSSPRKQLQNNLSAGLKLDKEILKNTLKLANLRPDCRAEDLDLNQWISLYGKIMV